jgi:xylulokinase
LDIGTGGCKAVVFSAEGKELAASYREYSLSHEHPDWAEIDPDEVIAGCFSVIRDVNSRIGEPVVSMCISSQGEAFTPVDSEGRVLGNAMVSSDSRARDITSNWSSTFGIDKIYKITGHTPHPLFTLFKLLWIKKNRPDVWQNTRYFLCVEDLFHYRVGLEPKISWPLAGRTMLFDVTSHKWSDEILEAAGLPASKLAIPVPSSEITGIIKPEKSSILGFKNPVTLVAGGHDQTCAALGAGVTETGMCMFATGSVECFCPVLAKPTFSPELQKNNLCCYDYTIRDRYTSVAYSLTGGNILRWMRDEFGLSVAALAASSGKNPYSLLLDEMPDKPTDILVLPYFTATGTPYFDTKAKGAIIGLKLTTVKGEITRALLEGVALEMKLNLLLMEESGMKVNTFIATGGGARNNKWNQIKADILNRSISVRNINEAGCYGAAMLSCSATEKIPVEQLILKNLSQSEIFTPDDQNAKFYDRKFQNYRELYPSLKKFWQ